MGTAPNGTGLVLDLTDRVTGATAAETDDEYAVEWQIDERPGSARVGAQVDP